MSTAYILDRRPNAKKLESIPEKLILPKTGESVIFDVYNEQIDGERLYNIFVEVIEEGRTYPQDTTDPQSFRAYFLSHDCFVIRLSDTNETIGGIYIKPNFPGRSSHIANGGLMVRMDYRGSGVGNFLMERFVSMGRQLGYEALYTNLVFVTNVASITLCKRYGFVEVGRLPKAGNLKGLGYIDALQLYRDLTEDDQ